MTKAMASATTPQVRREKLVTFLVTAAERDRINAAASERSMTVAKLLRRGLASQGVDLKA
jgi:hypothetical protein